MKEDLVLVTLTDEQIVKAKELNGVKKRITHALCCGSLGQIFGTEKHCIKYYSTWNNIFPLVFNKGIETGTYKITDYKSTFNLVKKIMASDKNPKNHIKEEEPQIKKSFFTKLFGA